MSCELAAVWSEVKKLEAEAQGFYERALELWRQADALKAIARRDFERRMSEAEQRSQADNHSSTKDSAL